MGGAAERDLNQVSFNPHLRIDGHHIIHWSDGVPVCGSSTSTGSDWSLTPPTHRTPPKVTGRNGRQSWTYNGSASRCREGDANAHGSTTHEKGRGSRSLGLPPALGLVQQPWKCPIRWQGSYVPEMVNALELDAAP
jgi:hypothetical protein